MKEEVEDLTDPEDFTDPEDIPIEEGREIIMVESKDKNDGGKAAKFIENGSIEIPTIFPPKLSDSGSFSIPCIVGAVETERTLCDLSASLVYCLILCFISFT